MVSRLAFVVAVIVVTVACVFPSVQSAAIVQQQQEQQEVVAVGRAARIASGDELVSSIINECFDGNTMHCLKGKVLTYLDTVLGLNVEEARSFGVSNVDEAIFDRSARILATNELRMQLPETFFDKAVLTYRSDRGVDISLPEQDESRGHLLKKKLLFPILLLLKLKMKALMPILVAIIGFKAMKALILSKLAILIVIGFIVSQLLKKSGMPMMPMSMMQMMPPVEPMQYGAPAPAATAAAPASSYEPSWEPSSGGPYARVWEPSNGSPSSSSAHNMAYSSYYPSASSSGSGSSASAGSTSTSSVSSVSGSSGSAHAY